MGGTKEQYRRGSLKKKSCFPSPYVINRQVIKDGEYLESTRERIRIPNGRGVWHKGRGRGGAVGKALREKALAPIREHFKTNKNVSELRQLAD